MEHLKKVVIAYVHFGVENPQQYRAAFMMPKPGHLDKFKYNKPAR